MQEIHKERGLTAQILETSSADLTPSDTQANDDRGDYCTDFGHRDNFSKMQLDSTKLENPCNTFASASKWLPAMPASACDSPAISSGMPAAGPPAHAN